MAAPGSPGALPRYLHRERLWPSWWVWAVVLGVAASLGLALLPALGTAVGVAAGLAVAGGAVGALVSSTPLVAVRLGPGGAELLAGRATLPLQHASSVEALGREAMARARGPELDARSYLVLRGWVETGVRVVLDDPEDPTPSWLLSSRRPDALARAAREGRRRSAGPPGGAVTGGPPAGG